jgi:arsenate reductase
MTAHWGVENSAAVAEVNEAKRYAILAAYRVLRRRIGLFVGLPIDKLSALPLQRRLNAIGQVL